MYAAVVAVPASIRLIQSRAFKGYLENAGLSQRNVAALVGLDYDTFRMISSGHRRVTVYLIARMESVLPWDDNDPVKRLARLHTLILACADYDLACARMTQSRARAWKEMPAAGDPPSVVR